MLTVPSDLHGRPFTTSQAAEAGVGRRALQGPGYASVHHGVFRTAETPDSLDLRVRGALLVLPDDAALSHQSALGWAGYDGLPPEPLHFSTASGARVDRRGMVVHRRQRLLRSRFVRGVPVLEPARTFVDVATDVSDRELLRVGDWLVRWGHVDLLELRGFVLEQHLDGVQRARRVAPLVRERVDSVRESDVRWIVWSCGLPVPEPNVPIVDEHGVQTARGDLVYVQWKVIVEHDGWHHERDAEQRQRDHLRRERLEALGWRVIVITVKDFDDERSIAWRIHQALVERGYRGARPRFSW
jgi:hypothetical protein